MKKWYVICLLITSLCSAKSCSSKCTLSQIKSIVSNIQNQLSSSLCNSCVATPITAPATITAPGSYCLSNDSTATITIATSNVTLNLNNHALGSISANGVNNVKIFNGFVQGGAGIDLNGLNTVSISDLEINNTTVNGINLGISEAVVIRNVLINNSAANGININNSQKIVIDNVTVNNSAQRGISVSVAGAADMFVLNSSVYACGDIGFNLSGINTVAYNCVASANTSYGFRFIASSAATAENCVSTQNATEGFLVDSAVASLINSTAEFNGRAGFFITNFSTVILEGCIALNNSGNGFNMDFNNSFGLVRGCSASYNGVNGFLDQTGAISPVIYVNNIATNNVGGDYSQGTTLPPFNYLLYTNPAANYWTNTASA